MNTPTPRTNRAWNVCGDDNAEGAWSFARTLERELDAERAKVETLRAALQNLVDEQNGAPLETRLIHWHMAMDEAGLALATAAAALR